MLLALDTSTAYASLALFDGQVVIVELTWRAARRRGDEVFPMLERALALAQAGVAEIDRIAVATGPGSFTGIRVAIATARGLARGSGAEIAGVSTLDALAYAHAHAREPVCALLPAGRDDYYAAFYDVSDGSWARRSEYVAGSLEEICRSVDADTLFAGELDIAAERVLRERLGGRARFATPAARLHRAGYLAELGWRALETRATGDLEPVYVKPAAVRGGLAEGKV